MKKLLITLMALTCMLSVHAFPFWYGDDPEVKDDSNGQRVLVIGDSTLDGVARRFADYARENGYFFYSSVWYGATVYDWAYTTELPNLLKKVQPTFVVISLGTNDLGYYDIPKRAKAVQEIVREVGDIPFVWIGPISLKSIKGENAVPGMIRDNVGADRFYDSYHLNMTRFPDGIHPTFEASAVWVDGVVEWMSTDASLFPIVMKAPKTKVRAFSHNEKHSVKYKGVKKATTVASR
ncbi:MAG: SGNH/GDSL hydrolase family protein [Oscillospiraceae bacterium]|nr:SGNH/GDSL hydrolase family protein [Oscillospiraceae bacterium]